MEANLMWRGSGRYSRSVVKQLRRCAYVLLGLALSVSLGLGARKQKEEDGPAAKLSEAPASAKELKNPFSPQEESEAVLAGRKLFQKHCTACHGSDGHGLGHAADLRAPLIQNAPPGVLFWAIQNGRPRKGMPPWPRLSDQQLWQIISYIQTLK